MGRNPTPSPATFSDRWPDDPAGDPIADGIRLIALRLRAALDGRSIRAVASEAGIDHTAVLNILNGSVWPQASTVLRLERALDIRLWPTAG